MGILKRGMTVIVVQIRIFILSNWQFYLINFLLFLLGLECAAETDLVGVVGLRLHVGLPPLLQLDGGDELGGPGTLRQPGLPPVGVVLSEENDMLI